MAAVQSVRLPGQGSLTLRQAPAFARMGLIKGIQFAFQSLDPLSNCGVALRLRCCGRSGDLADIDGEPSLDQLAGSLQGRITVRAAASSAW